MARPFDEGDAWLKFSLNAQYHLKRRCCSPGQAKRHPGKDSPAFRHSVSKTRVDALMALAGYRLPGRLEAGVRPDRSMDGVGQECDESPRRLRRCACGEHGSAINDQ